MGPINLELIRLILDDLVDKQPSQSARISTGLIQALYMQHQPTPDPITVEQIDGLMRFCSDYLVKYAGSGTDSIWAVTHQVGRP